MENTAAKYVHYLRVSTQKQGIDGYGIDAQIAAVAKYTPAIVFKEEESGKKKDRPELLKALAYCKKHKATLVVAKLDRLARQVYLISEIMTSGVEFIAVDYPQANKLTIHILAAVAEHEATMIADRTRVALAEVKRRGPVYCNKRQRMTNPLGVTMSDTKAATGRDTQKDIADRKAGEVAATVLALRNSGMTLQAVADQLNNMGVKTPRNSQWTPTTVKNCIARLTK